MFLATLKTTFESTKAFHRFIYENTQFFEDEGKVDQKNYNDLQIGVLKKIAQLKFDGDINKFIKDPMGLKTMQTYREYVNTHLPFLMVSSDNTQFDARSEENISKAANFILNKLYPQSKTFSAKGN